MPHRPGHLEPGFRAAEATDEQIRKRQAQLRKGSVRAVGGNQNTSRLREGFRAARDASRRGLNTAGKVARGVASEVAGGARQVARGLAGQGASVAGASTSPGAGGPTTTRAQQVGGRLRRAFTPAGRGTAVAGRAVRGVGRFARGVALPGAALAVGAEALGTPQEQLEAQSGLPEVTPLTGIQPGGQAPGAQAPVNLARTFDPLLAAARPAVGAVRGAFGLGAEQEAPAQQPAGLRAPQFGAEGERSFVNEDIGGGAVNRGTASVAENQGVASRLEARGIAERQAGLRAQAAGAPGAQPGTPSSGLLDQLGAQAAGGGLASAFAALNVGGNQLRREAADRSRGFRAARAQQDAQNKLTSSLTRIGAQNAADKTKNFAQDAVGLTESFNDAVQSGDEQQIENVRSSIFESAAQDPQGASGAAASNLLAEEIRENTESSFFGAIFNPFGAGRGPLDAISSLGQGGFNNEFQSAIDKMTLNESTGDLEIANPDGSGGTQTVTNIESLSPAAREFLSQSGIRKVGAGQDVTRGDPNRQDPNRPSLRSGF